MESLKKKKPMSDIRMEKDFLSFCFRQMVLNGKGVEMTIPIGKIKHNLNRIIKFIND